MVTSIILLVHEDDRFGEPVSNSFMTFMGIWIQHKTKKPSPFLITSITWIGQDKKYNTNIFGLREMGKNIKRRPTSIRKRN